MSNLDNETKKILIGALIGGAIGIGAISIFLATRREEKGSTGSTLGLIQAALEQVGDVLEHNNIDRPASAVRDAGKKIHKNEDTISEVIDWVSTGIHLWNKFKH